MSKKNSAGTDTASINNIQPVTAAADSLPTGSLRYEGYAAYYNGTTTQPSPHAQTLTAWNTLADADGLGTIHYTWMIGSTVVSTSAQYTLQTGTYASLATVGAQVTLTASYTDGLGNAESVSIQTTIGQQWLGTAADDNITGTSGDDIIYGGISGVGNDTLSGGDGNDYIVDALGNDALLGGNGDDTLVSSANTGTNADTNTLAGGLGNDTYIISGGTQSQNAIGEAANAGTDTVETTLSSFSLAGFYVENLKFTGSAASTGTGNFLANKMVGGGSNDNLSGAAGDDLLFGGGNQAGGADTLTGGSGKDGFIIHPLSTSLVNITDFTVADDTIDLESGGGYFTSVLNNNKTTANPTGYGVLNSNLFRVGAAAQDTNDNVIYNSTTGELFYDSDGSGAGAAFLLADLTPGLALTNQDIVLTNIFAQSHWFLL